ncbi:M16 family metallopeptidase [Sphingobacterium sp. MYb388]|uniref:M16 family metallopeptidase n=1 Tax=Sphingobacterium sp. MYb388 TaxID=2745437 RepID=UPI0030AC510D
MKLKHLIVGVFALLFGAKNLKSQELMVDPSVKIGQLPNGFRYYIKSNTYPEKRAVLYLVNKVGSILEEENERGIAHFIEHMNFKGTTHFPKNQLIDYLERAGVKFGADLNAYTSFDETVYQLPLPTDDAELWKNGMLIMRDWASEAILDKGEFEKERGVILEEKRLKQNATGRTRDQYMPMVYNFSRYADRSPIGLDHVISKGDIQVLQDFYKRWYRPDLQALIIVGDIDINEVETQIKNLFSNLKPNEKAPVRPSYAMSLIDSTRFVQVKDKELSNYQIDIILKRKSTAVVDSQGFRQSIIEDLTNNLSANRLQEIFRESSKTYLGLSMKSGPFLAGLESMHISASLSPQQWKDGFKSAWMEIERIKRHGFTLEELNDVKEMLLTRISLQEKEKEKIPSQYFVENYLDHFLTGTVYLSIDERISLTRQMLKTISVDEVSSFIKSYLMAQDRVILVMGADKDSVNVPEKSEVLLWMEEVDKMDISVYHQERHEIFLLDSITNTGKIVSQESNPMMGLTQWTLSNGVKVYAKPTDFKNDEIFFTAFSPGGSSLYNDRDYYSAMNASTFILNSGLGRLNASELSRFLNAKTIQVQPYIGDREEGISGSSINRDLETALGMVHLYMTDVKLDTARFNSIVDRSKSAMRNRSDDPNRAFADTVGNILGNYHFRRQPSSLANIEQIRADRLESIFRERFANAADFTFLFVGSFDVDSLKILTEKFLGSLPASDIREKAIDLKIRVPEGKVRKDLYMGQGDKSTVQIVYSGKYRFGMLNNQHLDALKAIMDFRLTERLRKQEGGVYSPSVQLTKAKDPLGFYAFVISFNCDPERRDNLIAAVREELSKIQREGVMQKELDKFTAEQIRMYELQVKSNQFWLSYLKGQLDRKESIEEVLEYMQGWKTLNLKSFNKRLGTFMTLDNEVIVTLSPGKK